MAVLVMGRGQIEQPWGQHTSIISIVSLVQRQAKGPGPGLRGCYPQHREIKPTVSFPEGDQDSVHFNCSVGQLFSLFLSDQRKTLFKIGTLTLCVGDHIFFK